MSTVARIVFFAVCIVSLFPLAGQKADDPADEREAVLGMVSLYKYMLNTVGSSTTPLTAKETIINESYLKIFRDAEVQVEDDLLANRAVILNKSVEAYLRDIDFFFQSATFDFTDISIDTARNENNERYYKVKMVVTLDALDLNDSSISRTYDRYVEINRVSEEGLKIVSVYTTSQGVEDQLWEWWQNMDTVWQVVLLDSLVNDSVTIDDLKRFVLRDSLDLSQYVGLTTLNPLREMRSLKYLNLSNTELTDLLPIRYANKLISLDVSYSKVFDLDFLHYLKDLRVLKAKGCKQLSPTFLSLVPGIRQLNLSETAITDFSTIAQLQQLVVLDLSATPLMDGSLFSKLTILQQLDLSNTLIQSVSFEQQMPVMTELNVSGTFLEDITFMKQLPNLKTLNLEFTEVSELKSLVSHAVPLKVFADFTKVQPKQVNAVMSLNKQLLVLTETEQVIAWWRDLPEQWRSALQKKAGWKANPSVEDLIVYLQSDSLDLSNQKLSEAGYLTRFRELRYLNLSNNYVSELTFVAELKDLKSLDISQTQVTDLQAVIEARELEYLDLSKTGVQSLGMLGSLPKLKQIVANDTEIPESLLDGFSQRYENILVIYRTRELQIWWDNCNPSIKRQLTPLLGRYSDENLHRLVQRKSLSLKNFELRDFEDVQKFRFLKSLSVSEMTETILPDLSFFHSLDSLSWERSPLISIEPLSDLTNLKHLSLANTGIDDLNVVANMRDLESLDCSGTQLKNVKDLRTLYSLKYLNISNTRVWQLNWLNDIRGIESLVCYNTRVSDRQLEQFKTRFPQCVVTNY